MDSRLRGNDGEMMVRMAAATAPESAAFRRIRVAASCG